MNAQFPDLRSELARVLALRQATFDAPDDEACEVAARDYSTASFNFFETHGQSLAVLVEDAWQPIETAPKDGSEIIAYGARQGISGYADDELTWTGVRWDGRSWRETKATPRYNSGFVPTHFRLVSPPAARNSTGDAK